MFSWVLLVLSHGRIGYQRALFSGSGSVVTHLPRDVKSPSMYSRDGLNLV